MLHASRRTFRFARSIAAATSLASTREGELPFRRTASGIRSLVAPHAVPWLLVTYDQLQRMPLDARDLRVIGRIDGRATVEMLLDLAGLPEDDTVDVLRRLVALGAVELHDV
jgi:hypothetical protein